MANSPIKPGSGRPIALFADFLFGRAQNRLLFNGPMHDGGRHAKGRSQPPDHIVAAAAVV